MPEELSTEIRNIVQEAVTKTIPKKKMQHAKVVVWRGFTNSWGKSKQKAREKGKDIAKWMQSSREYQGELKRSSEMNNAKK